LRRILILVVVALLGGAAIFLSAPHDFQEDNELYPNRVPISWRVGIAFPSSGLELFDRSSVGRWDNIVAKIKAELVVHGFNENNIVVAQSSERVEQVKQIDEMLEKDNLDCLIVVPVELSKDQIIAQQGDTTWNYLRAKYKDVLAESVTANDPKILENSPYENVGEESPLDENGLKFYNKLLVQLQQYSLEDRLRKAKEANILTVGFGSDNVNDFPFDYFFATPSAEDVANVQAGFAVAHLGLPELTADGIAPEKPTDWVAKNVEVMTQDALKPNSKRYFTQLWKRIKPYFDAGYLRSGSGLLTEKTTAEDYIGVSVIEDGDKAAGIMHNRLDKYYKQDDAAHRLSFVFAQTDAHARGAVRACVEAGWQQSSSRWPIITGSGAEKITVADIVEKKQAMSIAYDSSILSTAVAQYLFDFAIGQPSMNGQSVNNNALLSAAVSPSGTAYFAQVPLKDGELQNMLIARPVTITADNLKEFMVDSGYISPQEAGL
jgi:ABC-type xylose transport system substrate-binding protein